MNFKCIETVKYPLELTWQTLRDHLPEIAASQGDIEYVKVEKRVKKAPNSVNVVSTWKAAPELPGFLLNFIKPEMLIWRDTAVWNNATHTCDFDIETHYKVEDISCIGKIQLEAVGTKSTRIIYSGVFTITKTAKSSIFMNSFVIRGIEALAAKLIAHNFSKTPEALGRKIKDLSK
jgi:hypothetical protein